MLFNSPIFIYVFVPVTLIGFYAISRFGYRNWAIAWLVGASLIFYSYWSVKYLALIVGLTLFNYVLGVALGKREEERERISAGQRKFIFIFGITANLLCLGYFKYANFFIDTVNTAAGTDFHLHKIILPLGISFFTFQKIAYLVDVYRGETREFNILHFFLFVTFFPQLIAGPIVHHKEILPQFKKDSLYRLHWPHLAAGITIFFIGLFKKVVIADQVAQYGNPVFQIAAQGGTLTFFEAWGGALAYTFQLYFDFSAYSDMAIGLGRMFGIRLPLNFYSPYKAVNVIDFWRRWHITLSRFLRDYLYIPLGGNRQGTFRRCINLLVTMLLGGLWHGAGWTFLLWGGLHGGYLLINHAWRSLRKRAGQDLSHTTRAGRLLGRSITFIAVVIAWVLFRAESLAAAKEIYRGMAGLNGVILWPNYHTALNKFGGLGDRLASWGWQFGGMDYFNKTQGALLILLMAVVWLAPNTDQIMRRYRPSLPNPIKKRFAIRRLEWRPTVIWSGVAAVITIISLSGYLNNVTEFLYFQF